MGTKDISCGRRSFLQGMLACGVAASAGMLAGCSPKSQDRASAPAAADVAWDEEFDVVVVGSGTALVAALSASGAGAKTLVVEKGTTVGGTTVFGCAFWIPNNPLEKEAGIEDSHEKGLSYIKNCAEAWGGRWNEDTVESYMTGGLEMIDMLKNDYGYELTIDLPATTDYFGLPDALPKGRTVGISLNGSFVEFKDVWPLIQKNCEDNGVEIRLKTEATSLVVDEDGTVVGVVVKDGSTTKNIRAAKGVVIGTGGFDHDETMVRSYVRTPMYTSLAVPTNTGDGHKMAMAIGASLTNMQCNWGAPYLLIDPENNQYAVDFSSVRNKPGSIIVNQFGERFADEASSYATFNRAFDAYDISRFRYRNIPAFLICDADFAENYPMAGFKSKPGDIPAGAVKADSLDELAQALGIDVAGLAATVAAFNEAAATGVDEDWLRGTSSPFSANGGDKKREDLANASMGVIGKAPFYGIAMYPGSIGTNGGIETNGDAQALDREGNPIGGLYAVGNASSSIFGGAYTGPGATIGSGMVMAYLAGKHAAAQ